MLWHRRMAHLSYNGLAKMADSKMVQGLPVSGADFRAAAQHSCDVCARAKNGVLHGKTAGYSSQSNGLGERCWRTTMDRTRR